MTRRAILLLLTGVGLFAGGLQPTPQELFNTVRKRVAAVVANAPRYTCVESVVRTWYHDEDSHWHGGGCTAESAKDRRLTIVEQDRLRLDVGVVGAGEVFSWRGENQFRTTSLGKLVTGGPISSGTFFSLLADVFVRGRGKYLYKGFQILNGRRLALFEYQIPQSVSHYAAETAAGSEFIGYRGSFTVDPQSGELHTLSVTSHTLPASMDACAVSLSAEYQTITFRENAFQVPQSVQMVVEDRRGDPTITNTNFSSCHTFAGESVIHFDAEGMANSLAAIRSSDLRDLPKGLSVKLRLATPIDSDNNWMGDAVRAVVVAPVRDKKGRLLAQEGAEVTGRIIQLHHILGQATAWNLALRFDRLHSGDADYRMGLKLNERSTKTELRNGSLKTHRFVFSLATFNLGPGVGRFYFAGNRLTLDEQFVSDWETITPFEK